MEIYNITIQNTETPEIQGIIQNLDNDEDILMTAGSLSEDMPIDVQYIKPINQIVSIGTLPDEFVAEVKEKYGTNVSLDIIDFTITLANGTYGIDASIEVEKLPDEDAEDTEKESGKRLPLPVMLVVAVLTGILTIVLIVFKLIYKKK